MSVTKGSAPSLSVAYNASTNRRTTDSADANGNILQSGVTAFDVDNRITTATISGGTARYSYAPGNKRIWRGIWTGSTQTTDELTYYSGGMKLTAYNLTVSGSNLRAASSGYYEFFGGKMIKNATGYVTPDRLGSIGKFFPYGQERPSATTNGKEKFATYFRDSETGLDYADNRYHSSGDGRFLTADPYANSAGLGSPGSWNRYYYVEGDPINGYDPEGLCTVRGGVVTSNQGTPCRGTDGNVIPVGGSPSVSTSITVTATATPTPTTSSNPFYDVNSPTIYDTHCDPYVAIGNCGADPQALAGNIFCEGIGGYTKPEDCYRLTRERECRDQGLVYMQNYRTGEWGCDAPIPETSPFVDEMTQGALKNLFVPDFYVVVCGSDPVEGLTGSIELGAGRGAFVGATSGAVLGAEYGTFGGGIAGGFVGGLTGTVTGAVKVLVCQEIGGYDKAIDSVNTSDRRR